MSIVTVGPFKRIVDVHWGGELTVDLELNFWGESQDFFRCYEFTSIPEDAPEYWQPTYSPTRFASHIQLRPNKTAYASGYTTGVTSIFGENPEPANFTIEGMPTFDIFAAGAFNCLCLNTNDGYENPLVNEDTRMQRLFVTEGSNTVEIAWRTPDPVGFEFCEFNGVEFPDEGDPIFYGYVWSVVDNRGMSAISDDHSSEFARQTLDFSDFRVTRVSDGRVFRATGAIANTFSPQNQFSLIMTAV